MKLKIKKGDTVKVITGEYKGTQGKVLEVLPKENKALVEGCNMVSKSTKPSAAAPNGGIIKKEDMLRKYKEEIHLQLQCSLNY